MVIRKLNLSWVILKQLKVKLEPSFVPQWAVDFHDQSNQTELGRNYELSKQPTIRQFEERTCEKEVQFNDEN
jgi:hypothetical protein